MAHVLHAEEKGTLSQSSLTMATAYAKLLYLQKTF